MASDPVVIADYDPAWAGRFAREREAIARAFAGTPVTIEHVGSTSVPGLCAKPIVDILLGAEGLASVEEHIPQLEALGYEYVPEYEAQLPDRRYFRKPALPPRDFHLHAVARDAPFWRTMLEFRDALRADAGAAAEYAALKRQLARRFRDDRVAYTDAKAAFVQALLARASKRA